LLHAFVSASNGIARQLTLPLPTEGDAGEVTAALLAALSSHWQLMQTDGDLIRWPSCDTSWIEPALHAQRFQLDSICAYLKEPQPLTWDHLPSSMRIRGAGPEDEEALAALYREELRFHTTCVPFARVSLRAIQAFGEKLARLWEGGDLESGAPLVLVVEQDGEVIAMAQSALLEMKPDMEPGFTPQGNYAVIDNLCVREDARGKGVGTALAGAVFAACASFDLSGYLLFYNPANGLAARFWPKIGFGPLWTTYQRRNTFEQ
jgi:GNAT superfamily N-acetyltransferase